MSILVRAPSRLTVASAAVAITLIDERCGQIIALCAMAVCQDLTTLLIGNSVPVKKQSSPSAACAQLSLRTHTTR